MEKLPDVSLKDTLTSCLAHEPHGALPGHSQFYYPKKYGFGELFLRMAARIKDYIRYNEPARILNVNQRVVNGEYQAQVIINTVPWNSFEEIQGSNPEIDELIHKLEYSSVVIEYQDDEVSTDAHWTYYPDESMDYHSILWRENFCENSKGYWTETNLKRYHVNEEKFAYTNEYAYPLNTVEKPMVIEKLLDWFGGYNIYGLGRWGEWEHLNTDVTVEHAMNFVEEFTAKNSLF